MATEPILPSDLESIETQEWLYSLEWVLQHGGPERVVRLLEQLDTYAHQSGVEVPFTAQTPYINSIPWDAQPVYPGSRDIERRVKTHNAGRGAAFTSKRRPVALAYAEPHDSETAALRRERQRKGWTREKKEALIRGDLALLKSLSKRRH